MLCCNNLLLGRELKEEEKYELVAAAAYMHIKKEELARQFINQDRWNYIITYMYIPSAIICVTTGSHRSWSWTPLNGSWWWHWTKRDSQWTHVGLRKVLLWTLMERGRWFLTLTGLWGSPWCWQRWMARMSLCRYVMKHVVTTRGTSVSQLTIMPVKTCQICWNTVS